jgi:hypothetical protein
MGPFTFWPSPHNAGKIANGSSETWFLSTNIRVVCFSQIALCLVKNESFDITFSLRLVLVADDSARPLGAITCHGRPWRLGRASRLPPGGADATVHTGVGRGGSARALAAALSSATGASGW